VGNVLVLPDATLQVAEACSGVRSMMSLLVLAVLVAEIWNSGRRRASRLSPRRSGDDRHQRGPRHGHGRGDGALRRRAADGVIHEMLGVILFIASAILLVACARLLDAAPRWARGPAGRWADGMTLLQHRVALLCAVLLAGVVIVSAAAANERRRLARRCRTCRRTWARGRPPTTSRSTRNR
jgi:hypothetical protein